VDKFCEAIDHPFTDLLVGLAAVAIDTSSSSVPTDKGVTCDLRHVGRSDQVETQLPFDDVSIERHGRDCNAANSALTLRSGSE
jgi:hypothetical protein